LIELQKLIKAAKNFTIFFAYISKKREGFLERNLESKRSIRTGRYSSKAVKAKEETSDST